MRHDATVTQCSEPPPRDMAWWYGRPAEAAKWLGGAGDSRVVLQFYTLVTPNRKITGPQQTLCVSTLQRGRWNRKWVSDYVYTLQLVGEGSRATMVKRGHSRAFVGRLRQDGQVRSRSHYSRPAGLSACPVSWLPLKHVRRWSKSREWVGNLYTAASPSAAVGQARSGQRVRTSFLLWKIWNL